MSCEKDLIQIKKGHITSRIICRAEVYSSHLPRSPISYCVGRLAVGVAQRQLSYLQRYVIENYVDGKEAKRAEVVIVNKSMHRRGCITSNLEIVKDKGGRSSLRPMMPRKVL